MPRKVDSYKVQTIVDGTYVSIIPSQKKDKKVDNRKIVGIPPSWDGNKKKLYKTIHNLKLAGEKASANMPIKPKKPWNSTLKISENGSLDKDIAYVLFSLFLAPIFSESGRRYSNQSRRSWKTSEHDGLLGSGSFPRPSGAAGAAPKVDSNDHYQLNRSSEPYHPPRPYKAVPYSRRDTKDSYNDETFGGTEYASDDRAEEERRRRVSFEMMRKEQQQAFQDKQKLDSDKHKDGHVSDIIELLEDAKDGTRVFSSRSYELDESVAQPQLNNDSGKSSLQTPAFRPPVPPGFRSTILESTSSPRPLIPSHSAEVGRLELEENLSQAKAVGPDGTLDEQEERQTVQKMGSREQQYENTRIHAPLLANGQQIFDSSADVEVSNKKLGTDNQLCRTSYLPKTSETLSGSEINEFDTKKVMGQKLVSDPKQDHPTSILDKIFRSASMVNLNESSGFIEITSNPYSSCLGLDMD
ncbi:hypothetical protein Acr_14g0005990 [Actinidia rufa]|uniref:Uncharacterized protein n=1 Tax=Actinidia rufa TaxID=165716 RepID=A0A7J0FQV7_9ERIC|nr:hypothetical protein Acr_14g0005990 [Actinidia rufa]